MQCQSYPESLVSQNEIPVDWRSQSQLALIMALKSMKILADMAHLQYHQRLCHIKTTVQVWSIHLINWLSYHVNKDDGNRQTDRRMWQQPFDRRGQGLKTKSAYSMDREAYFLSVKTRKFYTVVVRIDVNRRNNLPPQLMDLFSSAGCRPSHYAGWRPI